MSKFTQCLIIIFSVSLAKYSLAEDNTSRLISNIKSDETIVFFRTAAWLNHAETVWSVPIHGWIYEEESVLVRKAFFSKLIDLFQEDDFNKEDHTNYNVRTKLLFADNKRGKQIVISIAGRDFALPLSKPNGHFRNILSIPVKVMDRHSRDGYLDFYAVTTNKEQRNFSGKIQLIPRKGISVISDIDDTVKITHVGNYKKLLEYTFYKDFIDVSGMSKLYHNWSSSNVAFHYVSSSPWQFYSPLALFLDNKHFPWATLNLKQVRFRDNSILSLFEQGTESKPRQIESILKRYPERKFILIGDSGEQDPEVYAGVMYRHPKQILKIYIRNTGNASADDARFTSVFSNISRDKLVLFDDPLELNGQTSLN